MFRRNSMLSASCCKTVSVCMLILSFMSGAVVEAQKSRSTNWYYPGSEGYEKGKISELKDKHRVYVSFFWQGLPRDPRKTSYRQRILHLLSSYEGLEVVKSPEEAELAVYISSFESGGEAVYDFYVLTRGERQKDGGHKPRVVVKKIRTDSNHDLPVIELAVASFIRDLKAVRGEK
jgi:hypothetical protein